MSITLFRIKILALALAYAFAAGMITAGTNTLYVSNLACSNQRSEFFISPLAANLNGKLPSTESIDFSISQIPTIFKKGKQIFKMLPEENLCSILFNKQKQHFKLTNSLLIKFPYRAIVFPFHNFW